MADTSPAGSDRASESSVPNPGQTRDRRRTSLKARIRHGAPLCFSFVALLAFLILYAPVLMTLTVNKGDRQSVQAARIKLADLFSSKLGKLEHATSDPKANADIQYAIGPLQALARWVPVIHSITTFFLALVFLRSCITSFPSPRDQTDSNQQTRLRRCLTQTRRILINDSIATITWPVAVLAAVSEIVFIIYLQQAILTLPVRDDDTGQTTLYSATVTTWPFVMVAFGALCAYLAFLVSYVGNHEKIPTTQSDDDDEPHSTKRWRAIKYASIGLIYLTVLVLWAAIFAYLPLLKLGAQKIKYTYEDLDLSSSQSSRDFWIAAFVFMALVFVVAIVALLRKCCEHKHRAIGELPRTFSKVVQKQNNLTSTTSQVLHLYLPFITVLAFALVCLSAVLASKATSQLAQSVNQMTVDDSSSDVPDDSLVRLAVPIVPAIIAAVSMYTIVAGTVGAKSACVIYKVLVRSDPEKLHSNLMESFEHPRGQEVSRGQTFPQRLGSVFHQRPRFEFSFALITIVACISACVIAALLQTDPLDGLRLVRWQNPTEMGTPSETGVDIYMYQSCPLNQFDRLQAMCDRNPSILNSQFGDWSFTGKLDVIARLAPALLRATALIVFIATLLYVFLYFKREVHCQRVSLRGKAIGQKRTCVSRNVNPVLRFSLLFVIFVLLLSATIASYVLQAELSHGTFILSSPAPTANPGPSQGSPTSSLPTSSPGSSTVRTTSSPQTTGSLNALSVLSMALTEVPPSTTNALSILVSAEASLSRAQTRMQPHQTSEPTPSPSPSPLRLSQALSDQAFASKRDRAATSGAGGQGQVSPNPTFRDLLLAQFVLAGMVLIFGLVGLLPECARGWQASRGRRTAEPSVEAGGIPTAPSTISEAATFHTAPIPIEGGDRRPSSGQTASVNPETPQPPLNPKIPLAQRGPHKSKFEEDLPEKRPQKKPQDPDKVARRTSVAPSVSSTRQPREPSQSNE